DRDPLGLPGRASALDDAGPQGDGDPAGEGRGYNVPSLLGVSAGAPYLHAGNARTLEALFSSRFATHSSPSRRTS
ncbi:MAG TPA: hypothetical protein VFG30_31290, partial [Polyangiales bacterium]|nr:hypothetical protein [Polyangiales bacterium]